jgi:hypothetical protein
LVADMVYAGVDCSEGVIGYYSDFELYRTKQRAPSAIAHYMALMKGKLTRIVAEVSCQSSPPFRIEPVLAADFWRILFKYLG